MYRRTPRMVTTAVPFVGLILGLTSGALLLFAAIGTLLHHTRNVKRALAGTLEQPGPLLLERSPEV